MFPQLPELLNPLSKIPRKLQPDLPRGETTLSWFWVVSELAFSASFRPCTGFENHTKPESWAYTSSQDDSGDNVVNACVRRLPWQAGRTFDPADLVGWHRRWDLAPQGCFFWAITNPLPDQGQTRWRPPEGARTTTIPFFGPFPFKRMDGVGKCALWDILGSLIFCHPCLRSLLVAQLPAFPPFLSPSLALLVDFVCCGQSSTPLGRLHRSAPVVLLCACKKGETETPRRNCICVIQSSTFTVPFPFHSLG